MISGIAFHQNCGLNLSFRTRGRCATDRAIGPPSADNTSYTEQIPGGPMYKRIGGSRGGRAGRTPPYGTKFFRFHIHFC